MIGIDPRTVVLFAALLAGLMTLILLSVRWSFGGKIHGLSAWAAGMAAVALACLLSAFRGNWPDLLSIVVANGLFLFSACSWTEGTLLFYGRPPRRKWLALAGLASALLIAWHTLAEPNYAVRLIVFTATASLLYATQAGVALRHGERHFVTWFFTGALMLESAMMLLRCVTGMVALGPDANFFSADHLQVAYLMLANSMPLVLSTGFFMAATRKIQVHLEELSRHDSLTNILNRRAFLEQFQNEQARHQRQRHELAVILLDIDHFKNINDTYGHAAGDAVLVRVCATVQQLLRKNDAFGRIGGEEFAILLPDTALGPALLVAERIRLSVAAMVSLDNMQVTLSAGITTLAAATETPQEAMRRADQALYRAKTTGRNRSVLAHASE